MKHLLYSILILVLFSCSKDEPEKPNTPPQAFEVTTKAEGTNVTLTWTDAVDADGDAVTYAVVYGADTLTKGLTTRTFTIKDLPYETEIAGTVVASDGKDGKVGSGFNYVTDIDFNDVNNIVIKDVEFEKFLINSGLDDKIDGRVKRTRVSYVTQLLVDNFENISSLEGIEAFERLTSLHIHHTKVSRLSLSNNLNLNDLRLYSNKNLSILEVLGISSLAGLYINDSPIESLNLVSSEKLRFLYITGLPLRNLDITRNTELIELVISGSHIEEINLTSNEKLEGLNLGLNRLKQIDIKSKTSIQNVVINEPFLEKLLLPDNAPHINFLWIKKGAKRFNSLNLDSYVQLRRAFLSDLGISGINVNQNLNLEELYLDNNNLTKIDLSKNHKLLHASFENNKLKSLDVRNNTKLLVLNGTGNDLSEICISKDMIPQNGWKKDDTTTYKVCD